MPVRLPANTGSVTAFKFRDPEGHPLELIFFPPGVGDPQWQDKAASGIVGYDHTAISVMDVNRSVAFYTELLGFKIGARSLNTGVEQDRLDGLTDCEVDVVALEPASEVTPHVELLHYRMPPGRTLTSEIRANDVASARQIHRVDDLDALVGAIAIRVPIAVDAAVESAASSNEVSSASFRSGSEKAFSQYSSVKPSLIAKMSRSLFADA